MGQGLRLQTELTAGIVGRTWATAPGRVSKLRKAENG
jgi:hypothetical protein